jgi:hypothetical protein
MGIWQLILRSTPFILCPSISRRGDGARKGTAAAFFYYRGRRKAAGADKRGNGARNAVALFIGEREMTGEEIRSDLKRFSLQSWSKQKGLNPIVVQKEIGRAHV